MLPNAYIAPLENLNSDIKACTEISYKYETSMFTLLLVCLHYIHTACFNYSMWKLVTNLLTHLAAMHPNSLFWSV